jgi:hypothetical protein
MLNSTGSTASGYFHLCKVWMSIVGGRPMSAQRYHSRSSSPRSQPRKLAGSLSGAFGYDADLNHLLDVFGKAIAIISRFFRSILRHQSESISVRGISMTAQQARARCRAQHQCIHSADPALRFRYLRC